MFKSIFSFLSVLGISLVCYSQQGWAYSTIEFNFQSNSVAVVNNGQSSVGIDSTPMVLESSIHAPGGILDRARLYINRYASGKISQSHQIDVMVSSSVYAGFERAISQKSNIKSIRIFCKEDRLPYFQSGDRLFFTYIVTANSGGSGSGCHVNAISYK